LAFEVTTIILVADPQFGVLVMVGVLVIVEVLVGDAVNVLLATAGLKIFAVLVGVLVDVAVVVLVRVGVLVVMSACTVCSPLVAGAIIAVAINVSSANKKAIRFTVINGIVS